MLDMRRIGDLPLACGRVLSDPTVAFARLGTLSDACDNVVLVLHGFTSGPGMILANDTLAEGSWHRLIGPGLAIDTDRFFVLCPNAIGSSYGSTGPSSVDPTTGRPYGPNFPDLAIADLVESQHRLLGVLGIERLYAIVGSSFGGLQAFQWGVDRPGFAERLVPVLASIFPPPAIEAQLRGALASSPNWHGGDYYGRGDMRPALRTIRMGSLESYGVDAAFATLIPDADARRARLAAEVETWAGTFDPNALLVLMGAMGRFDLADRASEIRDDTLLVLSRSDRLFPPALGPRIVERLTGCHAEWFEIDSDHGHMASGTEPDRWAPRLRAFLDRPVRSRR